MTTEAALAATATLVALAFAGGTLERWLERRGSHDLAWTIALSMFAIASGALWLGMAKGWDSATFRVFYLFGAIVNVPWLALGTVCLLGQPRIARRVAAITAALSFFAAGVVAVAPLKASVPHDGLPKGSDLFGVLPRVLAAVGSGVAALVVIAGAVWSAIRAARHRGDRATGPRLAVGNGLIAVGTLVLGASGTLAGRVGEARAFAITLVAGIVALYAGFVVATSRGVASAELAAQQFAAEPVR